MNDISIIATCMAAFIPTAVLVFKSDYSDGWLGRGLLVGSMTAALVASVFIFST